MPINKETIHRYNTLDKCFSDFNRKYSFEDLLNKVNDVLIKTDVSSTGIKIRQLREDVRVMKSEKGYSAPIKVYREGVKSYYRYTDKDFSINNRPLNSFEEEQIKNAISILQRFKGSTKAGWINEIAPILSSYFEFNNSDTKAIDYDTHFHYSGYNNIIPIFNAIVNKKALKIETKQYNNQITKQIFHPYYIKKYNNIWYVFGSGEFQNTTICGFALDEIVHINENDEDYIESNVNWEEYFNKIIGVTTPFNGELEEVRLLFSQVLANEIIKRPLHPSQKVKMLDNGKLLVTLNVIPNIELENTLLSFGEYVKIIKPQSLELEIIKRAKSLISQYT